MSKSDLSGPIPAPPYYRLVWPVCQRCAAAARGRPRRARPRAELRAHAARCTAGWSSAAEPSQAPLRWNRATALSLAKAAEAAAQGTAGGGQVPEGSGGT